MPRKHDIPICIFYTVHYLSYVVEDTIVRRPSSPHGCYATSGDAEVYHVGFTKRSIGIKADHATSTSSKGNEHNTLMHSEL